MQLLTAWANVHTASSTYVLVLCNVNTFEKNSYKHKQIYFHNHTKLDQGHVKSNIMFYLHSSSKPPTYTQDDVLLNLAGVDNNYVHDTMHCAL